MISAPSVMVVTREWYPAWGDLQIGVVPGNQIHVLSVDDRIGAARIEVNGFHLVVSLDELKSHAQGQNA